MIRSLRAFIWLRWRLLANSLRGGRRRDTLEQISRSLQLFTPIILGVMSLGIVVATSILAFVGGRSAANALMEPPLAVFIIRVALAVMVFVLVIFAVVVPSQATLTRYTRLLLLPISRRVLHVVEVAASLADPWLLYMVPVLIAVAIGMAVGGRPVAAAAAFAGGLALIAVLAALNALIGFLVSWLVRDRRRSEIFTLLFVLGVSAVSFIPALFSKDVAQRQRENRARGQRPPFSVEAVDRQLPRWTAALPTELYGRVVLSGLRSQSGGVGAGLVALGVEFVILFALSGVVHRQLLGMPEGRRRRAGREVANVSPLRLPVLGLASSAVAWAQLRTALRSVRGRLMILITGPLFAVLVLMLSQVDPDEKWPAFLASHGFLIVGVSGIFGLYALQPFSMNLFGADRAGLTLQFLSPISDVELARGKIAGCLLLLMPTMALSMVTAVAVAPNGALAFWIASFLGTIATFLWLSPVCVWLSALFPQASDLSKTGSGGNPHAVPMFAGTFLVLLVALPAGALLAAGIYWQYSPWLICLLMAAWTLLAAVVSFPLVTVASRTVAYRRENLALVAQGKS